MLAAVIGGGSTLLAGWMWVGKFVRSGDRYAVEEWVTITVPEEATQSLVYYESKHAVGSSFLGLFVRKAGDERQDTSHADEIRIRKDDHAFSFAGRHGRAFYRLELEEAGDYEFLCTNGNYSSDDEIPETDRVVFMKNPGTVVEVKATRRLIVTIGGSITVFMTLGLYAVHYVVLTGRRRDDEADREDLVPA